MRYPLNRFQQMLWQYAELYPADYYNLGLSFRLSANLNPSMLKNAFSYIVQSVDSLHTVLIEEDGKYWLETQNTAQLDFQLATDEYTLEQCAIDMKNFTRKVFDLATQQPLRVKLYKLKDTTWMLSIVFHHICIDGVSVVDLLNMLAKTYDALEKTGTYPPLDTSSLQVCSEVMQKRSNSLHIENVLNYWHDALDGKSQSIQLSEKSSQENNGYEYDYVTFAIGKDLNERISHLSKELATTPFLIMLSAWMLVMQRLSGQENIFIDTSINLRPSGLHNMIGFFVNNLPLSLSFTEDITCVDLIKSVTLQRKRLKKAQQLPFSEIIMMLKEKRGTAITGNTNVGINFVGWSSALNIPFQQVNCQFYQRWDNHSTLDLLLEIEPTAEGHSRICYNKTFDLTYVTSIMQAFHNVLSEFASTPHMPLSKVSLISAAQQKHLCEEASMNIAKLQEVTKSINEAFEARALGQPEKLAMIYGNEQITYGDMLKTVDRYARQLRHNFRLSKKEDLPVGEPIGVCAENKMQGIIWIYSILRAGGTYTYLPLDYPEDRLRFLIKDYGIRYIVSDQEQFRSLGVEDLSVFAPDDSSNDAEFEVLPIVPPDTNAYIISTSGTTGVPKGFPITHRQILNLLQSHLGYKYDKGGVILQYTNLNFDVSVWEIFGILLGGYKMVIATEDERYSPRLFIDLVDRESVSLAYIPPIFMAQIQAQFPGEIMPSLKVVIVGGDFTPEKVIRHWQKNRLFLNGYGPSENTVYASYCPMKDTSPANDIGGPILGFSAYVLDPYLNIQPDYIKGELYFGGPQLTSGYINRPELNASKFIPNPYATEEDRRLGRNMVLYATGDIVSRTSEGHFLIYGRKDHQVKIHGFRIELGEIEMRLNQHPSVARAAVVVRELGGDRRLVAYVQPCADVSVPELRAHLEEHLPYYMIPSAWAFVDSFPMTANGKLDLRNLPEPSIQGSTTGNYIPPVTSEERILVSVVASVCAIERVSTDVNLFDLGITSIQVMMIVSEAATLGLELSASAFYRYRTIREIARHCDSNICYWYKENDKPIAVIVCGDTYFAPDYLPVADQLTEHYSVLVLETYHEYMHCTSATTWQQVIEAYYAILSKALDGHTPQLFCGFCIGGEMALHIASLFSKQGVQPHLLLIDSFIRRDKSLPVAIDYPGTTEGINARRKKETDEMLTTQELPPYGGEIHLILASQFTTERLHSDKAMIESAQRQFEENESNWRRNYPQCSLEWVDAIHWDILKKVRIEEILRLMLKA